ncbi:uncharacterized protein RAG0_07685 [Rhynchosporium agropyri]|uniref:Uncharacterized protein n=1 Tax=Rhynchosporium agropyri TaxID=914238 RepID=A0A1E1KMP0_9HELO|nr:uncharacterized protein RAG0_07685 [Rhynchosporium agropyri]
MIWSTLLLALSAATGALAQNNATEPKAPQLTFLYSANATVGPLIDYGMGPWGQRVALPITGGTFSGPKLAGSIINLGADWGLIDSFGVFTPDTRYGLQTQDGANIYVRTSGPASTRPYEVHLRLVFETGHANYTWLNHIVAVGVLTGYPTYVLIDVWQMETL